MGCIFSTQRKPRKRRRGNMVRVQPIGNGTELVMSRTDFTIFRVKQTEVNSNNTGDKVETPKVIEEKCGNESPMVYKLTGVATEGVAFEISQVRTAVAAPPQRLLAMEIRSKEKEEKSVDEIKERLEQAERRRKQLADERILRVRKMVKTESPEVIQAYIDERKKLEAVQTKRIDDAVAARQQRLRNLRDRLREKDEHAKTVRRRKLVSLDEMGEAPREEKEYNFYSRKT